MNVFNPEMVILGGILCRGVISFCLPSRRSSKSVAFYEQYDKVKVSIYHLWLRCLCDGWHRTGFEQHLEPFFVASQLE